MLSGVCLLDCRQWLKACNLLEGIIVDPVLLAHLVCKKPSSLAKLTIFWTFSIPFVSFIRDINLIQRHDVICKSRLITQDAVFIFLDFIITDKKSLILARLIEIVDVRHIVIVIAAIINVRVYQCC